MRIQLPERIHTIVVPPREAADHRQSYGTDVFEWRPTKEYDGLEVQLDPPFGTPDHPYSFELRQAYHLTNLQTLPRPLQSTGRLLGFRFGTFTTASGRQGHYGTYPTNRRFIERVAQLTADGPLRLVPSGWFDGHTLVASLSKRKMPFGTENKLKPELATHDLMVHGLALVLVASSEVLGEALVDTASRLHRERKAGTFIRRLLRKSAAAETTAIGDFCEAYDLTFSVFILRQLLSQSPTEAVPIAEHQKLFPELTPAEVVSAFHKAVEDLEAKSRALLQKS